MKSLEQITTTVKEITFKPKRRIALFLSVEIEKQPAVLLQLSKHVQKSLLNQLSDDVLLPVLERLDPDDATDVLQLLPKKRQSKLIERLGEELRKSISLLLQFDPQTAAGLMSLNYVIVQHDALLSVVAEEIKRHEKRTGKIPTVLVTQEGSLVGYVPVHQLIFHVDTNRVNEVVKKVKTITENTSSDSILSLFSKNPHQMWVVTSSSGAILGVLYSDDILKIVQENEARGLYDFAGVNREETVFGTIQQKVRFRYKWLLLNLATAFFASFVVGLFDETISKYVLLAVYMPIVAGMGGNAATQTLAVMVRGIALGQIELATAIPVVLKEMGASLVNGLINGLLVAAVVILMNGDTKIALILATAMIINLLVAGFFGTLVPLLMAKFKKDPATSATVFITTATDVLGFLAFLGIATLLLR